MLTARIVSTSNIKHLSCFSEGEDAIGRFLQHMIKNQSEYQRFLRKVFVNIEIYSPIYWWLELNSFMKVDVLSTVLRSVSSVDITDFSIESLKFDLQEKFKDYIDSISQSQNSDIFRFLPMNYNIKHELTFSYAELVELNTKVKQIRPLEWGRFFDCVLEAPLMKYILN